MRNLFFVMVLSLTHNFLLYRKVQLWEGLAGLIVYGCDNSHWLFKVITLELPPLQHQKVSTSVLSLCDIFRKLNPVSFLIKQMHNELNSRSHFRCYFVINFTFSVREWPGQWISLSVWSLSLWIILMTNWQEPFISCF